MPKIGDQRAWLQTSKAAEMPPPFDVLTGVNSILRSRTVIFEVGPDGTEFVVQADALTRLSDPLRILLDGNMREAIEGRVIWDDVDDQTFVRFIQWAYTNDYVTAKPDILLDASNVDEGSERALYSLQDKAVGAPPEHRTCIRGANYPTKLYTQLCPGCGLNFKGRHCITCDFLIDEYCPRCRITHKGTAMAKAFMESTAWAMPNVKFRPLPNIESSQDYTVVLSCHANLYIIADKYDIPALSQLSMHRLYETLKTFALYPSRMSDILSLATLVFDSTREEDELRSMVVHYCACIVEDLAKSDDYKPTLVKYPEFMAALMEKMSERLD